MAECGVVISEHFTLIKILGGGSFGTAYLVEHIHFGKIVFKKVEILDDKNLKRNRFQEESEMHKSLHHPNIVHLFGVYSVETTCGLFLEYMEYGDVSDFLKEYGVTWQWKTQIVCDVAKAMVYLHTQQPCIIHGDLKPQNILIDGLYRAKVSDFGLACFQMMPSQDSVPRYGTLPYVAPEYLEDEDKQKTSKFDVYGFAISVWEIYSGKRHSDDFQVSRCTGQHVIRGFRPSIEEIITIPNSILQLIEQCWSKLEHDRPSFENIARLLSKELNEIGDEKLKAPEKITNRESFSTLFEQRTATLDSNSKIEIETVEDGEKFINGFNAVWLRLMKYYLDSENGLLECLLFYGVLTDDEYDELIKITSNEERNRRLIVKFIKRRIQENCKGLVEALIENEQEHIAKHIMSSGLNKGEDRLLTLEEIKIIDENMFGIISLIKPYYKKKFLYRLVSNKCLTSTHKDKIESKEDFPEKVDELMKILKRRRYRDLCNFKQCLHDIMQNNLVELFEKSGLVAIRVQLVNRPDMSFIESALIAHLTDYVDKSNKKTLTAEQRHFVDNLLKELEQADIRLLGTSAGHSMAVFFMCSTYNSLQEIQNKFETGRLKKILERVYRVLYKLPDCAPDLIESISFIHEQQHSKPCSGVLFTSEEQAIPETDSEHNPDSPSKIVEGKKMTLHERDDATTIKSKCFQGNLNWSLTAHATNSTSDDLHLTGFYPQKLSLKDVLTLLKQSPVGIQAIERILMFDQAATIIDLSQTSDYRVLVYTRSPETSQIEPMNKPDKLDVPENPHPMDVLNVI